MTSPDFSRFTFPETPTGGAASPVENVFDEPLYPQSAPGRPVGREVTLPQPSSHLVPAEPVRYVPDVRTDDRRTVAGWEAPEVLGAVRPQSIEAYDVARPGVARRVGNILGSRRFRKLAYTAGFLTVFLGSANHAFNWADYSGAPGTVFDMKEFPDPFKTPWNDIKDITSILP